MHNVSNFLYKTQNPNHRNKEPTPPSMPSFPISLFPYLYKSEEKISIFCIT